MHTAPPILEPRALTTPGPGFDVDRVLETLPPEAHEPFTRDLLVSLVRAREDNDLRHVEDVLVEYIVTARVAANPDHAAAWAEPDAFSPLDLSGLEL